MCFYPKSPAKPKRAWWPIKVVKAIKIVDGIWYTAALKVQIKPGVTQRPEVKVNYKETVHYAEEGWIHSYLYAAEKGDKFCCHFKIRNIFYRDVMAVIPFGAFYLKNDTEVISSKLKIGKKLIPCAHEPEKPKNPLYRQIIQKLKNFGRTC
jgi:hypothetical protein